MSLRIIRLKEFSCNGRLFLGVGFQIEIGEPGAGAIVAYLREATGKEPIVVGKPNPYIAGLVEGLEPGLTLVIGDKVETDAELARRIGADALVVREEASGVSYESWYMVAASVADFASLDPCEPG